jgi:UDP-N-acetylmuramate dehydrogenase
LDNKEIIVAENNEESVDVSADAGVEWHTFLTWCLEHKFYGLENLALIPGTIGAAPVQNIGAYGIEQADFFQSLEAFDTKAGENLVFNSEDCCFDYRYSIFKNELRNRYIVTNVTYRLNLLPIINLSYKELFGELNKLNLEQIMPENVFNAVIELRQRKLPDPAILGNAGSFFKNPVIENNKYHELKQKYSHLKSFNNDDGMAKIPAAQLIELCGWKGKRLGDAGVSENHALILVNYGNATGEEIIELSEKISDSVFDKFGIKLEKEVQVVE